MVGGSRPAWGFCTLVRFTKWFQPSCKEMFPREPTHAPLPHTKPQKRLFWRSRSKETQLRSKATEDSELYSMAQKLGRNIKAERCPRWPAEQSWSITCEGWGDEQRQREGLADRRVLLTQAKFVPVNNIQGCGWKQDLIAHAKSSQFSSVTYAISHIPAEATLSSPLGAWLGRRGNPGKEVGEDICKPTFLPKEGKQSLQWDCQCKGNGSQTELRGVWGWFFFSFSFSSQTFYLLSKVYSGCPKLPINLLKYFHQELFIFTQIINLKKCLETPKLIFFPPPSSSLSSELKKINYTQPQVRETPLRTYEADTFP